MNPLELAELELHREGKELNSKTFSIWIKRVHQINNYILKSQGHLKRGHKQRI